jgi:hypothetical protein
MLLDAFGRVAIGPIGPVDGYVLRVAALEFIPLPTGKNILVEVVEVGKIRIHAARLRLALQGSVGVASGRHQTNRHDHNG